VPQDVLGEGIGAIAGILGRLQRFMGQRFVQDGETQHDGGAHRRHGAEDRVDEEQQQQIDGNPRQVEGEVDAGSRHEGAELVKLAKLLGAARVAVARGAGDKRLEDPPRQQGFQPDATADQELRAQGVERRHGDESEAKDDRQQDERRHVLAHQHTVVDLHEIERRAEIEQVDGAAEQSRHGEVRPQRDERPFQLLPRWPAGIQDCLHLPFRPRMTKLPKKEWGIAPLLPLPMLEEAAQQAAMPLRIVGRSDGGNEGRLHARIQVADAGELGRHAAEAGVDGIQHVQDIGRVQVHAGTGRDFSADGQALGRALVTATQQIVKKGHSLVSLVG
jgi:hypothetical protein